MDRYWSCDLCNLRGLLGDGVQQYSRLGQRCPAASTDVETEGVGTGQMAMKRFGCPVECTP
jgi:hypothetical protein